MNDLRLYKINEARASIDGPEHSQEADGLVESSNRFADMSAAA
jgi:hypothetical protein